MVGALYPTKGHRQPYIGYIYGSYIHCADQNSLIQMPGSRESTTNFILTFLSLTLPSFGGFILAAVSTPKNCRREQFDVGMELFFPPPRYQYQTARQCYLTLIILDSLGSTGMNVKCELGANPYVHALKTRGR